MWQAHPRKVSCFVRVFMSEKKRCNLLVSPNSSANVLCRTSRFIQRSPVPFLQSAMAKPIMCCAIAACSLDHKDANASVMKFLTDMIKCMREKGVRFDCYHI